MRLKPEIIGGDATWELTERHLGAIAKQIEPGDLVYSSPEREAAHKERRADAKRSDPLLEEFARLLARRRLVLVNIGPFFWRAAELP